MKTEDSVLDNYICPYYMCPKLPEEITLKSNGSTVNTELFYIIAKIFKSVTLAWPTTEHDVTSEINRAVLSILNYMEDKEVIILDNLRLVNYKKN